MSKDDFHASHLTSFCLGNPRVSATPMAHFQGEGHMFMSIGSACHLWSRCWHAGVHVVGRMRKHVDGDPPLPAYLVRRCKVSLCTSPSRR
jgi:hypothetical protein